MSNAYDRVLWIYMTKVMRKMGFLEVFIDIILSLVANNWYSIIINDQAHRFFHFTRGLKQGETLSPTLCILTTEALFRSMNFLFDDGMYKGCGLLNWSRNLNYLAYTDNTIIFISVDKSSLQMVMNVLKEYNKKLGHLINKNL